MYNRLKTKDQKQHTNTTSTRCRSRCRWRQQQPVVNSIQHNNNNNNKIHRKLTQNLVAKTNCLLEVTNRSWAGFTNPVCVCIGMYCAVWAFSMSSSSIRTLALLHIYVEYIGMNKYVRLYWSFHKTGVNITALGAQCLTSSQRVSILLLAHNRCVYKHISHTQTHIHTRTTDRTQYLHKKSYMLTC